MPKKPKPTGWPRTHKASPQEANVEAVQRLVTRLDARSVPQHELDRYLDRLDRILRQWSEFRFTRPDSEELSRVLQALPTDEREALFDNEKGERRALRAKAKLFQVLLDEELLSPLFDALGRAVARAGSPDDLGALAVALHSLKSVGDPETPWETNPLLDLLLAISFDELQQVVEAYKEVKAREEARATADGVDEAERERRIAKATEQHPAIWLSFERRVQRLISRLFRYTTEGIIRTHLAGQDIASLADKLTTTAEDIAEAGTRDDEGIPPQTAAAVPNLTDTLRAFAAEPANDWMFQRFLADLRAEAAEAAAAGHPLAQRIADLVAFCEPAAELESAVRVIICEASLARLRRERREREAAAPEAPATAPPTGPEAPRP